MDLTFVLACFGVPAFAFPRERGGGECDGPEVCFSGGCGDGDQGLQSV
jgi:hypothetical protein